MPGWWWLKLEATLEGSGRRGHPSQGLQAVGLLERGCGCRRLSGPEDGVPPADPSSLLSAALGRGAEGTRGPCGNKGRVFLAPQKLTHKKAVLSCGVPGWP